MYTLHIANKNYSSWSLRPWILLRQLDIAFTEAMHPFMADIDEQRKAFAAFSPTRKVPVLQDAQTAIWDSLAIAEYLAERHAGVWPQDAQARAWARSAASEMHSGFGQLREMCSMNCALRARLRATPASLQTELARIGDLFNEGLSRFGGPFLAGPTFTAVDAMYAPVIFRFQTYGLPLAGAAATYMETVLALPAVRQWQAEAIAESSIDPAHEQAILAYADVVGDARKTARAAMTGE